MTLPWEWGHPAQSSWFLMPLFNKKESELTGKMAILRFRAESV